MASASGAACAGTVAVAGAEPPAARAIRVAGRDRR